MIQEEYSLGKTGCLSPDHDCCFGELADIQAMWYQARQKLPQSIHLKLYGSTTQGLC